MNKDFRISTTFFQHPKTRRLRRKLGDSGVLCLIQLWAYVAIHYPRGFIENCEPEEIEEFANWQGEKNLFFNTIASDKTRFIEQINETTIKVHDWEEHNQFAYHAKDRSEIAQKAARARWSGNNNKNNTDCMHDACIEHASSNANSINGACSEQCTDGGSSNAPSPIPSPIPNPNPESERARDVFEDCLFPEETRQAWHNCAHHSDAERFQSVVKGLESMCKENPSATNPILKELLIWFSNLTRTQTRPQIATLRTRFLELLHESANGQSRARASPETEEERKFRVCQKRFTEEIKERIEKIPNRESQGVDPKEWLKNAEDQFSLHLNKERTIKYTSKDLWNEYAEIVKQHTGVEI